MGMYEETGILTIQLLEIRRIIQLHHKNLNGFLWNLLGMKYQFFDFAETWRQFYMKIQMHIHVYRICV